MSEKSVQISVRISEDDALFLSRLDLDEAATPSEKMRALLRQARLQREGLQDFRSEFEFLSGLHRLARDRRLAGERRLGTRSELLRLVTEWIVETDARLLSALPDTESKIDDAALERIFLAHESDVADRVFALIDQVFRLGVTPSCAGYDPKVIRIRVESLLDLLSVFMSTHSRKIGEMTND